MTENKKRLIKMIEWRQDPISTKKFITEGKTKIKFHNVK